MPPREAPPRPLYLMTRLFLRPAFREFIRKRSKCPMDHPYAMSVQCEKPDGRKAMVARTKNASLFVTDLARSQEWYERTVGLKHLKTGAPVQHPYHPDRTVEVMAMGFEDTPDLFLVLQRDAQGNVIPVTDNGISHVAFWIESSTEIKDFAKELRTKGYTLSYGPVKHYEGPGGDGGWGGNKAVYLNDPDGHFTEFSNEMDEFGRQYPIHCD